MSDKDKSTPRPWKANAALIVKCVNEHDALCAVAEAAKDVLEQFEKSKLRIGPHLANSLLAFLKPALANLKAARGEK